MQIDVIQRGKQQLWARAIEEGWEAHKSEIENELASTGSTSAVDLPVHVSESLLHANVGIGKLFSAQYALHNIAFLCQGTLRPSD